MSFTSKNTTSSSTPSSPRPPSSSTTASIVKSQLLILLTQLGRSKESNKCIEKIQQLVDEHGMEVSSIYFRRLLQSNAAYIFSSSSKQDGSYSLLVNEMTKLTKSPQQAFKISDALDTTEADVFRDFDLSTFMDHFRLDPVAKIVLSLACRTVSKQDIRMKADAILTSNFNNFLEVLANPTAEELSPTLVAFILVRLIQDPPRQWNDEKQQHLFFTIESRYNKLRTPIPTEVGAAVALIEVLQSNNGLVKLLQRPASTRDVDSCKTLLNSIETVTPQQLAGALLFLVSSQGPEQHKPAVFVEAIRQKQKVNWQDVVKSFDRPGLRITKDSFLLLFHALLPIAKDTESFDIQALWGNDWEYTDTQLSFVVAFLSCTPTELDATQIPRLRTAFTQEEFVDASEQVKEYASKAISHPMTSLDATKALFMNIFNSQEAYNHAQSLGIPETVINANTDIFVVAASAVEKPWAPLQDMALNQLFRPFFHKTLPHFSFVLHALWKHDRVWLAARLVQAYETDSTLLPLIFSHAQEHGWLDTLIMIPNQFGLDLAAHAHGQGVIDMEDWAQKHLQQAPQQVAAAIANFLRYKAEDEALVQRDQPATTMPLKVKTVFSLLEVIRMGELDDDNQGAIQRICLQVYPRLVNYGNKFDAIIDKNSENGNALPEEADVKMQEQYKMMYSNDVDPRGMIERLQQLKESDDPVDQDLFACMIHGLFDEYNCFGEYPLEALATTAVLFGGIIAFGVLSSRITLGVALFMVLDAVAEYGVDDSMYKFGLQALLHFMDRLEEWPTFCNRLVMIPQLRGTDVYNRAEEILKKQPRSFVDVEEEDLTATTLYPPFSSIHVDQPLRLELYEQPDEETSEKVTFVLNNVSKRNIKEKFKDLKEALEERHHQWFASYLVEDLVKSQPNFQGLYLQVLNMFDEKWLWAEVLRETYHSLARLLNSDTTLTNSTDRTYLKNLAAWLGLLTLARNRPILHRNLSFKDFLIEAHQTRRLVVAIPFTCKVLAQAKDSQVFKPPQPWLMELIGLLMELYHFAELKLNLKFEIEVMLKELNLDVKTTEALNIFRTLDLHREEEILQQQYAADGLEGFGDMHLISLSKRAPNERFSSQDVLKSLPDLAEVLHYPPSSGTVSQQQLKTIFLDAAQRAITEIIAPVVERSVTIAAISTTQLIEKDFAMEPNPEILQKSAHNVVKALSGSLALVTCKEPLRMSISNNIRIIAAQTLHEPLPEGSILMFVNDNLDTVCKLVEDAAESQSKAEIDAQIEEAITKRRNLVSTEQFNYPPVSRWAFFIPEPYRQEPGGLNPSQLAIYEDFGRQRGISSTQHSSNASQSQDVIADSFLPSLPTPAEAPAMPRSRYLESHNIADRVIDMLSDLQRASREAPEEHIQELGPNAPVREIFEQVVRIVEAHPQKDALAIHAGQRATVLIYTDTKTRLEIEVLVQFLNQLCIISVSTARQLIMYLMTLDDDRAFSPAVVVSLLKAGLIDLHHVDNQTARAILQHRSIAIEFLGALFDELLLNEHPGALRADLVLSIGALDQYIKENPEDEIATTTKAKLEPTEIKSKNEDQLEYLFEEWVRLQRPDAPERYLAAFVWQLHKQKIIDDLESLSAFLRVSIEMSVAAYEEQESFFWSVDGAYVQVDALARLVVSLVAYHEDNQAKYFEQLLALIVLVLNDHHHRRSERFSARMYFRLFSSILCELHAYRSHFEVDLTKSFGKMMLYLNPRVLPGFSFSWLSLISHRMFLSLLKDRESWDTFTRLLTSLFAYLGDLINSGHIETSAPMQDFYRGSIRVILMLTHDFPEYFVENHMLLCSNVPENLLQMFNLLSSAYPGSYQDLPDPFVAGLKINRLEQVRQAPVIHQDIQKIFDDAKINPDKDDMAMALADKNSLLINAYVVKCAIDGNKKIKTTVENSSPSLRYFIIGAMANQLRHPNSHTLFYITTVMNLFKTTNDKIQQQIARVLVERLMTARPHPWGLIVTMMELIKNNEETNILELEWMKASPEIERMFYSIAAQGNDETK
ncbi:hypothetical protein AAFC00_001593 [Neodothiora populina]|uniref:Not1-domain-containing protein n=1 Tax=Neodothiora populina TaxID=2781224 RepID=A0ABR3PPE4_9PEZI